MKIPSQKKRVIKRVGKSVDTNMDVYRQRMKKLSLKPKKMNKMILKAMNKREVEAIENEVVVEVRGAREKDAKERDLREENKTQNEDKILRASEYEINYSEIDKIACY